LDNIARILGQQSASKPASRLQNVLNQISPSKKPIADELKSKEEATKHAMHLLDLVRYCHDGDRAVTDYRKFKLPEGYSQDNKKMNELEPKQWFGHTPWATDARNDFSDRALKRWISEKKELVTVPGGFERSLPEMDELADEVDKKFNKLAAVRVSAAGLGGRVCIHSMAQVLPTLLAFLEKKGWQVRQLTPGSPTQLIQF